MVKEELQVLSIQFQNEEVGIWKNIVKKLINLTHQSGYKKIFTTDEVNLIRDLKEEEIEILKENE